jgi:hypothetical protein
MSTLTKRPPKMIGSNGQSSWNRAVRDVTNAMAAHLGGVDMITTPEEMLIRRIAVFEAEMRLMEAKIAADRQRKVDPDEKYIDLYSRLVNAQRRLLESVGMKRVPRTVVPTLEEYIDAEPVAEGASTDAGEDSQ